MRSDSWAYAEAWANVIQFPLYSGTTHQAENVLPISWEM